MEETEMIVLAAVIAIGAAAAILMCTDVYPALKTALGRKPGYFNIRFKPERGTEFCRARLVGKTYRPDNRVLYVVEIHPKDAAKVYAWTVLKTELRGAYLLEKGKFYKLAFEEELYD